jgi:hypothetical protein
MSNPSLMSFTIPLACPLSFTLAWEYRSTERLNHLKLIHDRHKNALRLTLADSAESAKQQVAYPGLVDVAANGRLVGVEVQTGRTHRDLSLMLSRWSQDPVAGEFVSSEPNGTFYIELTAGEVDDSLRSSSVELEVELDDRQEMLAISIPRRGAGYEISYPSGNR